MKKALTVRPLTPELWPALEDLFGKHGASNGCWCMYWRVGSLYRERARSKNRAAFRTIVKRGPPPGLLAFDGELAIGWAQLTPRSDLDRLSRSKMLAQIDDEKVWSLSCFYVKRGHRGQGVVSALIAEALKEAKRAKAPGLEAYPYDKPGVHNHYLGAPSTFLKAGFREVARCSPTHPVMRHDLKNLRKSAR
jgi:predicted GNAT family acetyltransferase